MLFTVLSFVNMFCDDVQCFCVPLSIFTVVSDSRVKSLSVTYGPAL